MIAMHVDKNIGITGAKIHWMYSSCGQHHWCRKAIAIMGSFDMPYKDILKISPFDPMFNNNYVEGKGRTKEEALANMEKQEEEMADMLWM